MEIGVVIAVVLVGVNLLYSLFTRPARVAAPPAPAAVVVTPSPPPPPAQPEPVPERPSVTPLAPGQLILQPDGTPLPD